MNFCLNYFTAVNMDNLEFTLSNPTNSSTPISNEEAANLAEEMQKSLELDQQLEAQRVAEREEAEQLRLQREREIKDTRNKEKWGVGEYTKEIFAALSGGVQDTASSLITLPERLIDMATGEMAREQKEGGYTAEWDDWFKNDDNPIETKTCWGGALRGLTHY